MIRKMENYYDNKQLCDVVLVAGRRHISAHRMVLSAASDYFAAMFTSDVREATEKEVTLKQIDPEALAALVDYAYTGKGLCKVKKIRKIRVKFGCGWWVLVSLRICWVKIVPK